MKTNELVIVCGDIGALVSSMKMNYSLGYGVCETIDSVDGLYRAVLSIGKDGSYVDKLNSFNVASDSVMTLASGYVENVIVDTSVATSDTAEVVAVVAETPTEVKPKTTRSKKK